MYHYSSHICSAATIPQPLSPLAENVLYSFMFWYYFTSDIYEHL